MRTGNQPNAYAAIRNLVIGAFRRAGYANIAHARRYHACDDQRILTLYGYTRAAQPWPSAGPRCEDGQADQ